MIPKTAYDYCCEDISLIENYEAALKDTSETEWVCHHRLGLELGKTKEELKEMGLYYNRQACELCFMTLAEHNRLHNTGISLSDKHCAKISASMKGKNKDKPTTKYIWLTPNDELKIMAAPNAVNHHPEWIKIDEVD